MLFWASNFSVGVAVFSAVNRYLAKIMNGFTQYDVHMEETHHIHKIDAPSGTAITLAEDIVENLYFHMDKGIEETRVNLFGLMQISYLLTAIFTIFYTPALYNKYKNNLRIHSIMLTLNFNLCSSKPPGHHQRHRQ